MKVGFLGSLILASLSPALAFAHGSLAVQAREAVASAVKLFDQNPSEVRKQFQSVQAVRVGHEKFSVTISIDNPDAVSFVYMCTENESVSPVVWECQE